MGAFGDIWKTAWYNVKILFGWNLAAAVVVLSVAGIIFGWKDLTFSDMAQLGELFLSTLGILFLPGLGDIEGRTNSGEIVHSKRVSYLLIYPVRLALSAGLVFLMISAVVLVAKWNNGSFDCLGMICGVFLSAMYLGMIGHTASNIGREPAIGYIVSFGYYMFEFFSRGRYTSRFYVFSLLNRDFGPKYMILLAVVLLIVLNMARVWYKTSRGSVISL